MQDDFALRSPAKWLVLLRGLLAALVLLAAAPATAHQVPFSYLDLEYDGDRLEGAVTVHLSDVAHELRLADPAALTGSPDELRRVQQLLASRMSLRGERPLAVEWAGVTRVDDGEAWRLAFRARGAEGGALRVRSELFPYDPDHQTFVNLYENDELRQQWILARGSGEQTYYRGTAAGTLAVLETFVPAGAWHILIGPDHLLFLFGLLLLGGGWWAMVRIVTAFTIGHSITLSLAALGVLAPPAWLVEPAIAASIVVVGIDNLLQRNGQGRDVRAWVAGCFGLVHGFGFAGVLAEFGLPREALGWSLAGFNVGVELGQLAFVVPAFAVILWLRGRSLRWANRVVLYGSGMVVAGGTYWFVERVFG